MNSPKLLLILFLSITTSGLIQERAKAEVNCSSTYSPPATVEERRSAGLFDGKVARAALSNSSSETIEITLYHPDAPKNPFGKYNIEPNQLVYIGTGNYGSDWGIQMNNGPICILGTASDWVADPNTSQPYFVVKYDLLTSSVKYDLLTSSIDYLTRGNEYYKSGNYKKAIEAYNSAENPRHLDSSNSHPPASYLYLPILYNRGNAYYKLGEYEKAIKDYSAAIQLQTYHQFPEAFYNKAQAELALGREDEAASSLASLLNLYSLDGNYSRDAQQLEELDDSNLDGEIFSLVSEKRWPIYGGPSAKPRDGADVRGALDMCKKALRESGNSRRVKLQQAAQKLQALKQRDLASQVLSLVNQRGSCPAPY